MKNLTELQLETLEKIKQNYKNKIIKNKQKLKDLHNFYKFLKGKKLIKLFWDKTIEKLNTELEQYQLRIYIRKQYDFNNQKTLKLYHTREKYKNTEIKEFYNCITTSDDIIKETLSTITFQEKYLLELIDNESKVKSSYNKYIKLSKLIAEYNAINVSIRNSIWEEEPYYKNNNHIY